MGSTARPCGVLEEEPTTTLRWMVSCSSVMVCEKAGVAHKAAANANTKAVEVNRVISKPLLRLPAPQTAVSFATGPHWRAGVALLSSSFVKPQYIIFVDEKRSPEMFLPCR